MVSNTGVVAANTPGVGTARQLLAAASYGGDKAIFGWGQVFTSPAVSSLRNIVNLVSNTGVVASDTTLTTPANRLRSAAAAAGYGGDKAIFAFGLGPANINTSTLISNTGVVASDTPGVGTARSGLAAASYGGDKAIFGFGLSSVLTSITNLVSNTGVVSSDTPGVGTARRNLAAAGYSLT